MVGLIVVQRNNQIVCRIDTRHHQMRVHLHGSTHCLAKSIQKGFTVNEIVQMFLVQGSKINGLQAIHDCSVSKHWQTTMKYVCKGKYVWDNTLGFGLLYLAGKSMVIKTVKRMVAGCGLEPQPAFYTRFMLMNVPLGLPGNMPVCRQFLLRSAQQPNPSWCPDSNGIQTSP